MAIRIISPPSDKPKNSHFLKWLFEVWGMVCRLKDTRGKFREPIKALVRDRGLLFRFPVIIAEYY